MEQNVDQPERARRWVWSALRLGEPRGHGPVLLLSVVFCAVLAIGLGLSACGGGGSSPRVADLGPSSTTTTEALARPASTTTTVASAGPASAAGLEYAKCMRSHGVPDFPDPNASGGFELGPGINPQSPTFQSAQAMCQRLSGLPSPGPGPTAHPSAAALAHMLTISRCMRRHGISDFPDPTTSMPSTMSNYEYISDRDGVFLAFPRGFDDSSPEFTQAAAACGFALTNH
jgi:hypothetical protein